MYTLESNKSVNKNINEIISLENDREFLIRTLDKLTKTRVTNIAFGMTMDMSFRIARKYNLDNLGMESIDNQYIASVYVNELIVSLEKLSFNKLGNMLSATGGLLKESFMAKSYYRDEAQKLKTDIKKHNLQVKIELNKPVKYKTLCTMRWSDENELIDYLEDLMKLFKTIDSFYPRLGHEHEFSEEIFAKVNWFDKVKNVEQIEFIGGKIIKSNGYEFISTPPIKDLKVENALSESAIDKIADYVIELTSKHVVIEENIKLLAKHIKKIKKEDSDVVMHKQLATTMNTLKSLLKLKLDVAKECVSYIKASTTVNKNSDY